MQKLPQVLTDFNTHVDGEGFAGVANKITLPEVIFKTLDKDLTGNAGAFEIFTGSIDKLESEVELSTLAATNIWSLIGSEEAAETAIIFRGSLRDGANDVGLKITYQGIWKSIGFNDLEKGAEVATKYKLSLRKFVLEVDGEENIYINLPTWEVRINGNDLGSKIKSNLGL
jgi:P2 family phage contractile tail tube protein